MENKNSVTVFMGGDVFSTTGITTVQEKMPALREKYNPDFIIWNGENTSGGNGLLESDAEILFSCGIDVITGGNHIFEKRDSYPFFQKEERILRPQNYPEHVHNMVAFLEPETEHTDTPGRGFNFYTKNNTTFAVLNLQGRESMTALDCPFKAAVKAVEEAEAKNALLFVDFHAESNKEKEALAFFLDGRACAVCGTHTHVQTADERILPKGTAYITDLGMTGAAHSAIGSDPAIALKRNLTQVLYKMENAENEFIIQGVLIKIDIETKKALSIERINF